MSKHNEKKLSLSIKVTITLAVLAVVLLILSIVSAVVSVDRTKDAIDDIGVVEYTQESKEKIDRAISYYDKLDANINLPAKITNIDTLVDARREYVRLAIKRAYLADKNGEDEEIVKQYVQEARQDFKDYCSTGECNNISNYQDLVDLEAKYGSDEKAPDNSSNSGGGSQEDDEIELC